MNELEIKEKLLSELNDAQKKAVEYSSGPELVIACAGSGKTRVLTYKIAYLIAGGMEPYRILALTFTRKAAGEMRERISRLIGEDGARQIVMGTFHSVFAKMLRQDSVYCCIDRNFVIYDQTDATNTVSDIIKSMGLSTKTYPAKDVNHRISWLKNNGMHTPETYLQDKKEIAKDHLKQWHKIGEIFQNYQDALKKASALDFDDILLMTLSLLKENPEVLERWQNRFDYILVDEYQDTNAVQDMIVRMIARKTGKICVVGDDAQSIYAFRGAIVDNIIDFGNSGAQTFKLEENYRSTPDIVGAANSLIEHNRKQIKKTLYTNNPSGDKVHICRFKNKFEEAKWIAELIEKEVSNGHTYDEYTVLYRMNSQSASVESELVKFKIPYKIYGGITFFDREEIKALLAYMRLAVNPNDSESFKRIFDYPARRIADRTLSAINECAARNGISLYEAINPDMDYGLTLANKGFVKRVNEFRKKITLFTEYASVHNAVETSMFIFEESGMKDHLMKEKDKEDEDRIMNVMELINMEKRMMEEQDCSDMSIADFLSEMSCMSLEDDNDDEDTPKVKLMTMHGSKGLEFKTVFIVGCVDGVVPIRTIKDTIVDIEEERRLAYVGITRAKERLYIMDYDEVWLWGKTSTAVKSEFINQLDKSYTINENFSSSNRSFGYNYDDDDDDEFDDDWEDEYEHNVRIKKKFHTKRGWWNG